MRCVLASLPALLLLVVFSCATGAPPTRSPLREQLATADTPTIEDAARACLDKNGWKVDPVGSISAGSNVVHATKAGDSTEVYVHGRDVKPRVTGGPDEEKFWQCMTVQMGGGGAGAPAESASAAASAEP